MSISCKQRASIANPDEISHNGYFPIFLNSKTENYKSLQGTEISGHREKAPTQ